MENDIENYFGDSGVLAKALPGFESRPGQLQMAKAIGELINAEDAAFQHQTLLVEAETGIGKTLAYLIPSLLSGKKIVISTATINLQDQILQKEIPLLEKIVKDEVSALCIKGRQNYLCFYRWFLYKSSPQLTLYDDENIEKIDKWLEETDYGDRAELDWLPDYSTFWPQISAKSHQCLGGDCPEAPNCFVNKLRRKAGSAQLLIANHHLFFSDLILRQGGYGEVLPRYQGVVFDEAHHLEDTASSFFGRSFSQYQIFDLMSDIERQADADLPPSMGDKIILSSRGLKERIDLFTQIFPEQKGKFPLVDFIEGYDGWYDEVKNICVGLERLEEELAEFEKLGEGWKNLRIRVDDLLSSLMEIGLPDVILEQGKQVHWYERKERALSLSTTPINVAENLRKTLYPHVQFCIMTSATLTTSGDFSYIRERLGVPEESCTLHYKSPFDYTNRTCLYIPDNSFPMPQDVDYQESLCEQIHQLLTISGGRALILCTSFRGLESITEYLEKYLEYPLLVQGRNSRQSLLADFREIEESVLIGVASFWEGVDISGDALRCVIIDKLPFEAPNDPVLQARLGDIRDNGGNPFYDFQVPRAILTLRQGIGRLMRSVSDSGILAIMDRRLYGKSYGKKFLRSLPPSPIVREIEKSKRILHSIL